ncbi:MAG: Serine/threonine kinase [Pseudomonadota bacterium]
MSNPLPPLVPDSFSGRRLGKYEIVCRLSTGGMSVIFLAFTRGVSGFRKYVVLKQILPDVKGEDEFVRMFLDEAKITAAFNHPHIAQVFDLDVAEGELFLTMEFVPGATLVEVARACRAAREPIPMGLTLQSVRDTAVALHYAHTFTDPFGNPQPVIHRDIAEKNIMVTYEGVTKLLDFGIAKSLKGHSRTSVGMVKGTSGYMSPEQIRGEKLDARTDIFSLGVVLHELLTGVRLFAARSTEEALVAPLQQVVEPPSRQNPEVRPELDAVVMRCLERDRAARYGTALELARALERAVQPGSLWHPEESAAFMQRIFAERREQTRALLSSSAAPSPSEMHAAVPGTSTPRPAPAPETAAVTAPLPSQDPELEPGSGGGYDDDELPEEPGAGPALSSSENSLASGVTGPTQAPVNRPTPGIKRRTSPARPVVRTAQPARADSPPPSPAAAPAASAPPAGEQKAGVGLYVGLGLAVLAVFGAVGWLLFSSDPEPTAARPPQPPARPEPKPSPLPARPAQPEPSPLPVQPPVAAVPEPAPADAGTLGAQAQQAPDAGPVAPPPPEPPVDAGLPAPPPEPTPSQPAPPPSQVPPATPRPKPAPQQPSPVAAPRTPKRPGPSTLTGDGSGFLTIVTVPAELKVMLGTRVLGETPLVKVPLPEGTHQLRLVAGDGQATNLSVSIRDGEVTAVRKTLTGGE